MKLADAKREIFREWDAWVIKHPDAPSGDGLFFFMYLQKEKPRLLDFRCPGYKWQSIHGWLLLNRKVKR
jgi:hypothetical protein